MTRVTFTMCFRKFAKAAHFYYGATDMQAKFVEDDQELLAQQMHQAVGVLGSVSSTRKEQDAFSDLPPGTTGPGPRPPL